MNKRRRKKRFKNRLLAIMNTDYTQTKCVVCGAKTILKTYCDTECFRVQQYMDKNNATLISCDKSKSYFELSVQVPGEVREISCDINISRGYDIAKPGSDESVTIEVQPVSKLTEEQKDTRVAPTVGVRIKESEKRCMCCAEIPPSGRLSEFKTETIKAEICFRCWNKDEEITEQLLHDGIENNGAELIKELS